MKNRLVLLLVMLVAGKCCSQQIYVLSDNTKEPVPFACITIKAVDQENVQTLFADTNGIIRVPSLFEHLKIQLVLSAMGYKKIADTVVLNEDLTYYLDIQKQLLDEVVITGQYAPGTSEKAIHKIHVIDRKKIESMGAQTLRDVLTNEMNIRLSEDNVLGSSMSLQGISGQNIKILMDGVPVTGRLNGNIDISQIIMNNVARIEIVEGPLSVNYGTDALAGTINIITKKSQEKIFSVSSTSYYQSCGQYNTTARIGYRKNKNSVAFSGGRNYFDGWSATDRPFYLEQKRPADSTRYQQWKPKEQYFGTWCYNRYLSLGFLKDGALKLDYTGDYFYEQLINKGLPRLPYYEKAFDDYYGTYRINNALNFSGQLSKKYYSTIIFAYNQYKRIKSTYYKDLTTLHQTLTEDPSGQDTSKVNSITARGSINTTQEKDNFNYEIGYDINQETAYGLRIKNNRAQIGDYALFTSAEYKPVTRLTFRPGIRLIYNTSYKAPLTPSLHVRYELNDAHTFRFSYANGFRSPSLKELYFYFVDINHNIMGNENLKAEKSHNFSLSTSCKQKGINSTWKTESSFFYNYITNLIALTQLSGATYTYSNVDKFQSLGMQLQTELTWNHFKVSIGGAYIGRYNQLTEKYPSEKFTYSPEGKCNLVYAWEKRNLTFSFFYKYTGELPSLVLNEHKEIYKAKTGDYHTADISLSKLLLKKRINFSLGSKNIFNVRNVSDHSANSIHAAEGNSISVGMGRTYFVKLDINLNSKQ